MFINYNKITDFENKLIKVFEYFSKDIINLHNKEINEDNLFGKSKISNKIQIIYIAILLGVIERDNTLKIKNYNIDINKFKKELACSNIDIIEVYKKFGLLNDINTGINSLEIEDNFIIEPNELEQSFIYNKQDINKLIEENEYCEYIIPDNNTKVYLLVEDSDNNNKRIFLEL